VRRRLDAELVRRGLVNSRARAADAVVEGRVLVAGVVANNTARQVGPDEPIALRGDAPTYVSRGGTKLAAALDHFAVDVAGRIALDVGASTGGFTDCLLQRGADHVVALDVGRAQLAWSLRNDERVTVMERTNVRDVPPGALQPPPDLCVADVSFISLRTVAPHLLDLTAPATDYVLLVKPQFEAGRARIGKGGVVRDPAVHAAVLREVADGVETAGLGIDAVMRSPLRGADGNVEFFAHAARGSATVADAAILTAVEDAP
jgi:23S rRNA (cytidine1920-2'-O)/16S rRNA (cytidine1409-2'-O)-methyltransferase